MNKPYTNAQIRQIAANLIHIIERGNFSPSEIIGSGDSKYVMTKNTYIKFRNFNNGVELDWCPRVSTIVDIVNFINKNFYPSITGDQLIHVSLKDLNLHRLFRSNILSWYVGTYYCYYLDAPGNVSDSSDIENTFGFLRIYEHNQHYYCIAALGFSKDNIREICDSDISIDLLSQNNMKSFEETYPGCIYYSGQIIENTDSLIIQLTPKNPAFLRILVLKRYDCQTQRTSYIGGACDMLTTSHIEHPTKFQRIILSRKWIDNLDEIEDFLTVDNLLGLNHIIESPKGNNTSLYHYLQSIH